MPIIKNELAILEYDTEAEAVIMPTHEGLDLKLPRRAVYAFLADHVDDYARAHNCRQVATFVSVSRNYPIYVAEYEGEEICLCRAPMGAAPAAQIMDWLIGYGAEKIISAGCCGALEDLPENTFLVPCKALRDEGTSYHYAPPSRYIEVSPAARGAIALTLARHGLPCREVITWSTDGFYRETKEMVQYRRQEGCAVVEMECAALAACAQLRGVTWGQILFTADTLADADKYDERGWGEDSFAYALTLCFDAVKRL